MDSYAVILRPMRTEKTTDQLEKNNTYVFEVVRSATKDDIRTAVESIFGVKIHSIRTMNIMGKTRRFRNRPGQSNDWKKAVVRLVEGQGIDALR